MLMSIYNKSFIFKNVDNKNEKRQRVITYESVLNDVQYNLTNSQKFIKYSQKTQKL